MTIEFDDNDIIIYSAVYLPRDIMAAVFDITIIAWSKVIANREINISSTEPVIAGYLGRAMTKEKNSRPKLQYLRQNAETLLISSRFYWVSDLYLENWHRY